MRRIEPVIVRSLFVGAPQVVARLPHLKAEYFSDPVERLAFEVVKRHLGEYGSRPTLEQVGIMLDDIIGLPQETVDEAHRLFATFDGERNVPVEPRWLDQMILDHVRRRQIELAGFELVRILTDRETPANAWAAAAERAVISIRDAQAFSFDRRVNSDFLSNVPSLLDAFGAEAERKFRFRLEVLNRHTRGGVTSQTLNVVMAASGIGKTLFLVDVACGYLLGGHNVLYVNLELRPRDIKQRFAANLFDRAIQDLGALTADDIAALTGPVARQAKGARLVIENLPPQSSHVGHIEQLIKDLKAEHGFVPDVVLVDHITICGSRTLPGGNNAATYKFVKTVAEELRLLAFEHDVALWTAVQTNRAGYGKKSVSAVNISESIGTVETADLMLALTRTDALDAAGLIQIEILDKNRYSGATNQKCVARIDRPRMRLYDPDPTLEQNHFAKESPVHRNPTRDDVVRLRSAGIPVAEIARQLNIPASTVKSHLHRARQHGAEPSPVVIQEGERASGEPDLPAEDALGPLTADSAALPPRTTLGALPTTGPDGAPTA